MCFVPGWRALVLWSNLWFCVFGSFVGSATMYHFYVRLKYHCKYGAFSACGDDVSRAVIDMIKKRLKIKLQNSSLKETHENTQIWKCASRRSHSRIDGFWGAVGLSKSVSRSDT